MDYEVVIDILWVHSRKKGNEDAVALKKKFHQDFVDHFDSIRELQLHEIELGKFFNEAMKIMHKYGISFEPNFANLIISLIIIEFFVKQMNMKLNIVDFGVEYNFLLKAWEKKIAALDFLKK